MSPGRRNYADEAIGILSSHVGWETIRINMPLFWPFRHCPNNTLSRTKDPRGVKPSVIRRRKNGEEFAIPIVGDNNNG